MLLIILILICIFFLLLIIMRKIDIAIDLIYNRLNIDEEIWGDDQNVWCCINFYDTVYKLVACSNMFDISIQSYLWDVMGW